jgi:hypothetical protein
LAFWNWVRVARGAIWTNRPARPQEAHQPVTHPPVTYQPVIPAKAGTFFVPHFYDLACCITLFYCNEIPVVW